MKMVTVDFEHRLCYDIGMKTEKSALYLRVLVFALVVGFAGGLAVGHWAWPGGGDTAADAEEGEATEVDDSSKAEGGGGAREGEEDSGGVTATAGDAEEKFVEAVPAESVKEDDDSEGEATVEEVRDEEDGLTDEERAEKFKRENPEEWERIQKRRRAMMAELKKAVEKRQSFLDAVSDEYLTEEQRKTHAEYAEALATRAAARERVRKAVEDGKEPDSEDFRTMNRADRVIRTNAEGEKRTLQEAAARSMGFSGEDVTTFVEMLRDIEDATDVHGFK